MSGTPRPRASESDSAAAAKPPRVGWGWGWGRAELRQEGVSVVPVRLRLADAHEPRARAALLAYVSGPSRAQAGPLAFCLAFLALPPALIAPPVPRPAPLHPAPYSARAHLRVSPTRRRIHYLPVISPRRSCRAHAVPYPCQRCQRCQRPALCGARIRGVFAPAVTTHPRVTHDALQRPMHGLAWRLSIPPAHASPCQPMPAPLPGALWERVERVRREARGRQRAPL